MHSYRSTPTRCFLPLLLAAVTAAGCDSSHAASKSGQQGVVAENSNVPLVITIKVAAEDLVFKATMPGSVRAEESAELYANVGGYLQRMEVDIGDNVEQGQVLAVVSVPEMLPEVRRHEAELKLAQSQVGLQAAARQQAKASVVEAEADMARLVPVRREKEADRAFRQSAFERWKQMLEESPSIERRKLDEARHQLEAAEAAVELVDADSVLARARLEIAEAGLHAARARESVAKARVPVAEASLATARELMRYAEIKAPFAGVITERYVHPGAFIRPASTNSGAMPVLHIQRIDKVRVSVQLPMDTVASLNRGDRVLFDNVAAAPGDSFEGTVTRISGALGERSRMMRAEVEFDNPVDAQGNRKLHPGYYGDLTVYLDEYPETPVVPPSAVFTREGQMFVFSVADGVVRERAIEAVFEDGVRVGVRSGLSVGEAVISTGVSEIKDGQRVRTKLTSFGGK